MTAPGITAPPDASLELSRRRTGLSFQRTRMSADRTLMSVMRTALSLISFGFTIFQFFRHLEEAKLLDTTRPSARNFGLALVLLGVGMLVSGITYHLLFMRGLRQLRESMKSEDLIHGESSFPVSFTLVVAVLLLIVGLLAGASIAFHSGPFLWHARAPTRPGRRSRTPSGAAAHRAGRTMQRKPT